MITIVEDGLVQLHLFCSLPLIISLIPSTSLCLLLSLFHPFPFLLLYHCFILSHPILPSSSMILVNSPIPLIYEPDFCLSFPASFYSPSLSSLLELSPCYDNPCPLSSFDLDYPIQLCFPPFPFCMCLF